MKLKSVVVHLALIVGSICVAVLFFEIYIRFGNIDKVEFQSFQSPLWIQDQTLTYSPVDKNFGRPNIVNTEGPFKANGTFNFAAVAKGQLVLDFSVRTNNFGFLSDHDYVKQRDPSKPEYRILVFGDSLAGTVTANYQWVDTIEELLNDEGRLKVLMGGKVFRIYNMGWPASGFPHFWDVYEQYARELDPNMIVVNFVYDDFPRSNKGPRIVEESEMLDQAVEILSRFKNENLRLLITQMPIFDDLFPKMITYPLTHQMLDRMPKLDFVDMRSHLPIEMGRKRVERWYNYPFDGHMSDYGGELYARAMAGLIAQRLTGESFDFRERDSAYFDSDVCLPSSELEENNQLSGSDFKEGVHEVELLVGAQPVDFGDGWRGLADGSHGPGKMRIMFKEEVSQEGLSKSESIRFFRTVQTIVSSKGVPSLTKFVGSASTLAGEDALLTFKARSPEKTWFRINFHRAYAVKGEAFKDNFIQFHDFLVDPTWKTIQLRISIPQLESKNIQGNPDNHFRFNIHPVVTDKLFSLDVRQFNLRRFVSRSFDQAALNRCAKRPREVSTVFRVASNQDIIQHLRNTVWEGMYKAKIWGFHFWAGEKVFRKVEALIPPLTKPFIERGFLPIAFGEKSEDVAYLNLFCTRKGLSLDNPGCYNNLHFFVK